ncbi:ATP-dependent helicase [Candidatus Saccharibacteria bacterium]|nr:ATP-dependent helicase [Candidatus Saccharibacteria bacterium]
MERAYKEAFAGLNAGQRQAVETIDGPVLVIAGPGTGKTQLIGTRVGHILETTDTPADTILLLTFTEAGVQAMRERLSRLIGKAAYDVQLNTYHAFGGEIFRRYPDYFEGADLSLIEELGSDSLLRSIIAKLPYSNPLKFADNYVNDLKSFISEAKRALLSPNDIEAIAANNLKFVAAANKASRKTLDKLTVVSKKAVPIFEELLAYFSSYPSAELPDAVLPMVRHAQAELEAALAHFAQTGKTTALTGWKRSWLAKDESGNFIIDGQRLNQRLKAAAGIYRSYQQSLLRQHQYDYDDMILLAIAALESNPELKYSLAEQYSYIMLDEFQDTNPAQFRLVELLTDHPVHEGRPNVLAVGDDDQAIYAFQGAEQGNMAAFAKHYKDVRVISLVENYRSQPELVEVGQQIVGQIQNRLYEQFEGVQKQLKAAVKDFPEPAKIEAREFKSDAAQYDWIASQIKKLTDKGIPAGEVAVLAPKHRYILPLLPYLVQHNLPIRYERRENILDEPLIQQLERMSQLILALADGNETLANSIWPEVLSYDFWQVPTDKIWRINWQSRESHEPWTAILLNDETLNPTASFFLRLATLLPLTSLEQQMDALIGLPESVENLKLPTTSPLYNYYFSSTASQHSALEFTKLISDLNVLRSSLRDWRRGQDSPTGLRAFIEFTEGHRAANLNLLNTSPYHEAENAVNLLTAYGAKGREFQTVFLVAALDEVWGSASRNQGYRLSLPANLSFIRYQGASEDERLRLLFVATTRAKTRLYLTSYKQDLAGKNFNRLKYLGIQEDEAGQLRSDALPPKFKRIKQDAANKLPLLAAANYWQDKHTPPLTPELQAVLKPVLGRYQLSATHLNQFTDIVNAGPDTFFMRCLLGFPSAPTITSAFGTAIHNSLRFTGNILINEGSLPSQNRLLEIFTAQIGRIELPPDEQANLIERGRASLHTWLEQRGQQLKPTDRFEYDFQAEAAAVGATRLAGKIDRLIIDEKNRKITVVDYKTGQSYRRWQSSVIKLHKFQQQLYFYKLLIESSVRFRSYKVEKGIIEFVEPDANGQINQLELAYSDEPLAQTVQLINSVWKHIQNLEFPNVSTYLPSIAGIKKFEANLRGDK